ncbi:hypothetical protein A5780_31635 [Nocardia sp. 852002-20019_SCH5090214]|nr:hypothetical protein A5780_31635 [Nocardia sp. 852002-20019_SCH5090214]PPJ10775.1 hypothetical protein C5E51_11040 [Nocardia nova]PPJ17364.1 hypothetical protein C5E44_16005 [Nocardia nova]
MTATTYSYLKYLVLGVACTEVVMVVYPITTLAVGCSADFEAVESFDSTARTERLLRSSGGS